MIKYLIIILFSGITFSQISPGDLTKAHASLEGLSNCTKCHELGEKVLNSKCLDCHTEIKQLINANRGYHASNDVKGKNCWSCHSEHHGRNFQIVRFDKNKFDHKKTGYELIGKHKEADCISCHKSEFIINEQLKKRFGTFLGLETNCISCHEDVHQGTLSKDCSTCHNTNSFKPPVKFDHNKTNFVLTGKHLQVECTSCHKTEKRNGKNFQKFKGLSFTQCSACHKDIHEGKFGNDCQKCHNTNSFKSVNTSSFDHNKTNFPLVGKHNEVSCTDCHGNNLSSKPKHEKCIDCHKDFHNGEFNINNQITDCSSCHNLVGFRPSTFTIERHKISFPLIGSHLAIPCQSCHYKNSEWHFKKLEKNCIDCHENIHGEELTNDFLPNNDCSSCHTIESWQKISFSHDKTNFPLLGKHLNVTCAECHYKENDNNFKEFKFVSLTNDCIQCHDDIHYGQFSENNINNCFECHSFNNWFPDKFNHSNTKFKLTGAHQSLECNKCHFEVIENEISYTLYKLKDFKCATCHS